MSTGRKDELLQAYQRELTYLRKMGAEFAARYPKIAARLDLAPDQSADPHVERLIESFAFLTGRIQQQIDDEFPEFTSALLGILYPQSISPVPSMTIAQFGVDADQGLPLSGFHIERHTRLFAQTHSGLSCRFRTCFPLTLWPIDVVDARIESVDRYPSLHLTDEVVSVLRIRLGCRGAASFADLDLRRLRFFISGEGQVPYSIYELLFCNALRVGILPDKADKTATPTLHPTSAIRPVGFEREEGILPSPSHAHPGYRLLKEYFTFPEKFLFFDVNLRPAEVKAAQRTLDILVLLNEVPRTPLSINKDTFLLGCTPIVNLFPKTSEPIRLDHRQSEYRLVADQRLERTTEIHSIQTVSASADAENWTSVVEPFFSFNHPAGGEHHKAFYHMRRRPTGREDMPGTDVYLSFVDLNFRLSDPPDQTLYAHTLCTNRDLAARMSAGAVLHMEEAAPLKSIACLRRPTPQIDPPMGGQGLWQLISHLSLNYLSLSSDPESLLALREILRLYRSSTQLPVEQQIMGITEMKCRPILRHLGEDAWRGFHRGLEVTLVFNEDRFVGASAILLSAVLSRFLGSYAAVNSFTQLVVRSMHRKGAWKKWPPMVGEQLLL